MKNLSTHTPSRQSMNLLSHLLLGSWRNGYPDSHETAAMEARFQNLTRAEFDELVALASSNHVIVRGMEVFLEIARKANDEARTEWAQAALEAERARIGKALPFLHEVCLAFEHERYDIAVIKSLDHWPDLGSDLDLYTNATPADVSRLMKRQFSAQIAPRSWGDRLARKWNFILPGLPEAVEIHVGRLGQTGEQVAIASTLAKKTRRMVVGNLEFRVPSASDRIMISTLQRMYRHFYFRLCDIVDSAALADAGGIDYVDLRSAATHAGIWEGVATYLTIVSDYVKEYSGSGLDLPGFVRSAAHFGGERIYFGKEFLRVPIMPQSARLYGSQLAGLLRRRELQSGARLSLLPWLATAAVVGQKLTGSDKGIW